MEQEILNWFDTKLGQLLHEKCGDCTAITKKRSGKILRKLMRSITDGENSDSIHH
jgi:acyl-coenzyme A synthetase/AMP-(fatty) acid ligase